MKREIKFRAWDEANKVMHFDFQFVKTGDESNDWILFTSDKQSKFPINEWSNNPYFSQQLKIMQFTGLHDKNGKEIWEGDIYKIDNPNFGYGDPNVPEYLIYQLDSIEDIYGDELFLSSLLSCEIIGNIFENSELLKPRRFQRMDARRNHQTKH